MPFALSVSLSVLMTSFSFFAFCVLQRGCRQRLVDLLWRSKLQLGVNMLCCCVVFAVFNQNHGQRVVCCACVAGNLIRRQAFSSQWAYTNICKPGRVRSWQTARLCVRCLRCSVCNFPSGWGCGPGASFGQVRFFSLFLCFGLWI